MSSFVSGYISITHYSSVSPCPLPIKSLSSALKASIFRSCQDPLVSGCIPKLHAGTWKVEDAVLSCENNIKINQVYGNSHHNRQGLGYTTTPKVPRHIFKTLPVIYFRIPQINSWHLCLLQSCPTASSGSVDKMDELC